MNQVRISPRLKEEDDQADSIRFGLAAIKGSGGCTHQL